MENWILIAFKFYKKQEKNCAAKYISPISKTAIKNILIPIITFDDFALFKWHLIVLIK